MISKKDLLKRLRADPMYRDALKMAPTDEERKKIIAQVEGFLSSMADALAPTLVQARQDPNFAAKLREALKAGAVVKESDGKPVADVEPKENKGEEG